MLRGWFAQPSQDAELLSERHDTISFFVEPANAMYCAQLLPQLQALLSKTKDVGNVQARMQTKHASCMPHAYTMRTPYSHNAPYHPHHAFHHAPPQASFARGGLLLADYINAMSTAMCAVKVRGCLWLR